jgi:methionyl-tRNA formyltransferase
MRLAIVGQQAFGKAVLEAFCAQGHDVAGVFVPPQEPGERPDPLAEAAAAAGIPVHPTRSYGSDEAQELLRSAAVELAVMAYVTQFVPQSFCTIPAHGTIQFHPSLLPLHRGPSAISWAIISGRGETGLTIFRPSDGLDEGTVILQKKVAIGPDDTLGTVYFEKIFPLGVAALVEAAEAVVLGTAREWRQDEASATYEGWVRAAEARIDWAKPIGQVYDLVRGCNPSPGAWTTWQGRRLTIFDARKRTAHTFAEVRNLKPGQVASIGGGGFAVHAQGGFLEVMRCRIDDGRKIAGEEAGVVPGTVLE